jgi:protein-tyrosine phosphatase
MRVLTVCTGNICRSPIAHGLLEQLAAEHQLNWQIDSAGTIGFHNGEAPDSRSIRVMQSHGINISHQRARKLTLADFDHYDLILALDQTHFEEMLQLANTEQQKKNKNGNPLASESQRSTRA